MPRATHPSEPPEARMSPTRLFALAASLALSACVINNGSGGDGNSPLSVRVTANGGGCESAGVDSVRVAFTGGEHATISQECLNDAPVMIVIGNVASGNHRLQLDALSAGTVVLTGTFDTTTT